jgi:cytidylate kinase
MVSNRLIITISREEGSGGREIAQQLARKLKYTYIDKQIIQLAAKQLELTEAQLTHLESEALPRVDKMRRLITHSGEEAAEEGMKPEDKTNESKAVISLELLDKDKRHLLWRNYQIMVEKLIQEVARESNAVILGYGANFALKDRQEVVSIFIHAPYRERVERLAFLERISSEEAARRIAQIDEQRACYMRQYYGADWHNPNHYHLIVNTNGLAMSVATAAIYNFVKEICQNRRTVPRLDIHRSYETLATRESYTPQEAAELTLTSPALIRAAAWRGELKAIIINHKVLTISREALLDWMRHSH